MGQVTKPTHGITTQCVNNLPSSGLEFFCAACSVNLAYGRVITASHLFPSASSLFIVRETHHTVHSLTPGHGRRYSSSFTPRAGSTQVTQEQLLCYLFFTVTPLAVINLRVMVVRIHFVFIWKEAGKKISDDKRETSADLYLLRYS